MSMLIEFSQYPLSRSEQRSGMIGKYTSNLLVEDVDERRDFIEHEVWNGLCLSQEYLRILLEMYSDIYSDDNSRDQFAYTKFRGYRDPERYKLMLHGTDDECRIDYISLAFLQERVSHPFNGLVSYTGLWPDYNEVEVAYLTHPAETRKGYAKRNTAIALDCTRNILGSVFAVADIEPANSISLKTFKSIARLTHKKDLTLHSSNFFFKFEINPDFDIQKLTEDELY